jgi:hypothetical protein
MACDPQLASKQVLNTTIPDCTKVSPYAGYGPLFDQYKLFVEKTHDYWGQFVATNEFFLKINGLGIAAFAWMVTSRAHVPWPVLLCLVIFALALARAWYVAIDASGKLNAARHEIIQEWELQLLAQPYRCEYQKLYCEPRRKYRAIQPAEFCQSWRVPAISG